MYAPSSLSASREEWRCLPCCDMVYMHLMLAVSHQRTPASRFAVMDMSCHALIRSPNRMSSGTNWSQGIERLMS
jgi:hypothetical protein